MTFDYRCVDFGGEQMTEQELLLWFMVILCFMALGYGFIIGSNKGYSDDFWGPC